MILEIRTILHNSIKIIYGFKDMFNNVKINFLLTLSPFK